MRILISGYYGFGNVGDESVLTSIIQGFKQRDPKIEITVLSAAPRLTAELNGVRTIYRYAFFKVLLETLRVDVVVSGGGTLFQDLTSNRSFWYYSGIVLLAKLLRKKVMVFAQGFGPLQTRFNQKIARVLLNRVDLITLRDEDSYHKLKDLGINRPDILVTGDPSALLEIPDKSEGRKILSLEGVHQKRPLLGISVRSLFRQENLEDKILHALAETLDYLVRKYHFQPVFLLFQCPEDLREASKVANQMQESSSTIFRICRPHEMLSLFSHFELLIGMRLHSLIFAAMNAVPMLGISYDPKVEAFMRSIDQPCVKFPQNVDTAKLKNRIEGILAEKETIKKDLEEKKKALRRKAEVNFELFFQTFKNK